MAKKIFTWFHARIFVLVLFTAFLSFCNQAVLQDTEGTEGNGILATTTDNINSSNQIPTGPIAGYVVYTPFMIDPYNENINTLTPEFCISRAQYSTTFQIQVYLMNESGSVGQRIYTSPYLPVIPSHFYQNFVLPSGILTNGLCYWWSARFRYYTTSSAWSWASFSVVL